jgi:hypothetical protein
MRKYQSYGLSNKPKATITVVGNSKHRRNPRGTRVNYRRVLLRPQYQNIFYIPRWFCKLRTDTLQRLVNVLWAYSLEGNTNPTKAQLGLYRINISRAANEIRVVKQLIELIRSVPDFPEHMEGDQSDRDIGYNVTDTHTPPSLLSQLQTKLNNFYGITGSSTRNSVQYSTSIRNDKLYLHIDDATAEIPYTKQRLEPIEKVLLELGLSLDTENLTLKADSKSIQTYLHRLTTIALREHKILDGRVTQIQQITYGERFFNLYQLIISGSGRVTAKNSNRRWFYEDYDNGASLANLLTRDRSYQTGKKAMMFTPKKLAESVMARVIELFTILEFEDSGQIFDPAQHILLPQRLSREIEFRDLIILFKNTIGYRDGSFIIDLDSKDSNSNRIYSVFTSISSKTRLKLGYINYDINAAMPTIAMQLLPDGEQELYPLHQRIVDDRTAFRNEVMKQTGKSLDWVKTELSKLDNMVNYNTSFEILDEYFQEGETIRDSVITHIKTTKQDTYDIAFSCANNILDKRWDQELRQLIFEPTEEKKESSLFFFIWTQFERKIREAMKSVFENTKEVIDVHDAVYSKEEVDIAIMEQAVYDQTGFKVKISH